MSERRIQGGAVDSQQPVAGGRPVFLVGGDDARAVGFSKWRLVSLFDVLRLRAHQFVEVLRKLAEVEAAAEKEGPSNESIGRIATQLQLLAGQARQMELSALADQAQGVMEAWKAKDRGLTLDAALYVTRRCRATLETELREHVFVKIQNRDKSYFESRQLSEGAAKAFPTADEELLEAASCFALERYSASVFHAMIALEPVLRALLVLLDLEVREESWGRWIQMIEAALASDQRLSREVRDYCHAAAVNFRYFKNAWRNPIMHGRASRYSRDHAESILRHVVAFVESLSPMLREA